MNRRKHRWPGYCLIAVALTLAAAVRGAPAEGRATTIEAGAMDSEARGDKTVSVFTEHVVVTGNDIVLRCDRLQVITSRVGDKTATIGRPANFQYLLATGHVRILQAEREATCGRAEVIPDDNQVILTENPIVTDHGNNTTATGDRLVLLRGERRVTGTNVRIVGPPIKDLGFDRSLPPPAPNAPSVRYPP